MNLILFEAAECGADGFVEFGGERAAHVLDVLHGEVGQVLKTGVVDGPVGTGEITAVDRVRRTVTVRTRHDRRAPAPWFDLILSPPRPRTLKRLLPQLAALGARRVTLVGAEKTEKAYWGARILLPEVARPHLVEGLMQGGASELPRVEVRKNLAHWLARGDFDEQFAVSSARYVAHPGEGVPLASPGDAGGADGLPLLAIGPEGGWTEAEVAAFERKNFRRVSLGERILRTDTAVVALVARLMNGTPKESRTPITRMKT